MKRHLVLAGGGHVHLTTLLNAGEFVKRGHRVTLIGPSPYHYYSGMGPGMLAGLYRPEEIRFHVKKMVEERGASFLEGRVVRIDPKERSLSLSSGEQVSYDVVSFNVGSDVPLNGMVGPGENAFTVKPIANLLKAREATRQVLKKPAAKFLVVGGGPAGLEMAGNLWRLIQELGGQAQTTLLAGREFLARRPQSVRKMAGRSLSNRGIEVVEGSRVIRLEGGFARLADGREFPYDLALLAMGVRPSDIFEDSGLPCGEDGGLLVNVYLQSVAHPEIFGGGDCASFRDRPLDKVGVYAVRQNPILYHNLMAALEGGEMMPFEPKEAYLLIFNLGDGRGIFWRKNLVFDGKTAFWMKDYIDRKFMRKFQVSGELEENRID